MYDSFILPAPMANRVVYNLFTMMCTITVCWLAFQFGLGH